MLLDSLDYPEDLEAPDQVDPLGHQEALVLEDQVVSQVDLEDLDPVEQLAQLDLKDSLEVLDFLEQLDSQVYLNAFITEDL